MYYKILCLRILQVFPVNDDVQWQKNPLLRLTQVLPFWQGLPLQCSGGVAVWQWSVLSNRKAIVMYNIRLFTTSWYAVWSTAGSVFALCAMQENDPWSCCLRLVIVSIVFSCCTPGSCADRNPSEVDVITLYLWSWSILVRSCPFLLHDTRGRGIPSALQLKVTFIPILLVTELPLAYSSFAGTA